ncbi:MAG TPA: c-type cytochrome [Steroidobacteraceae bacterium]|jgi:cytochrome c5|nr:c-type cytochrome [Steroidobacteraceae bacterium]
MAKHDRHFINVFSAVLGILIAIALILIGIARFVDKGPKGVRNTDDPLLQASAHERVKPFGEVAVSGEDNSAKEIAPTAVAVAAAPAAGAGADQPTDGKTVYQGSCNACHGSGLLNAPKLGDKAAWAPRIAKGIETLDQHALGGFNQMPAKGGNVGLSDEAVKAAVEYMVAQGR